MYATIIKGGIDYGLRRPTFFTRDQDFYHPWLRHPGYCLVFLEIKPNEAARYIRHFLRYPMFRTQKQRMGIVARVHNDGINFWGIDAARSKDLTW